MIVVFFNFQSNELCAVIFHVVDVVKQDGGSVILDSILYDFIDLSCTARIDSKEVKRNLIAKR